MIKKLLFTKFNVFIFLLFAFSGNMFAQCAITSTTSTSSLTCGTSPLNACGGVLYIGDGVTAMNLTINSGFDLTCLGAINFVIRNKAKIEFGNGANDRLTLAAGSSITVESGGDISGGNQCTASDRIYVGTDLVSTCSGGANVDFTFTQLVIQGGYSPISVSSDKASVCGSGNFTFTATSDPASGATYEWFTTASGGSVIYTGNSYSTGVISSTQNFYVQAKYASYTTIRKLITATVIPNLTASVSISASANPICAGTSVTFTATPTNGGLMPTYQWYNGLIAVNGATSATYTSNALANNDAIKVIMTSNATPCLTSSPATSNGVNITVSSIPTTPTLNTPIQPTCTSLTGSFIITNYNASYTYAVSPSTGVTISGNTVTAPAGSYTLTAALGTCISTSSSSVTISNPVTTTWNGTSWSNGIPVGGSNIIFTGSYPPVIDPAIDLSGCSCQVLGTAIVTIKSDRTLTVVNELNVLESASLIFENNASLVQTNDASSNSGNIIYRRLTTPIKKFDYTYWSSPVSPQTLYNVSPTTLSDKFFSFDSASEDWKQESSSTTMSKGKGYIIRAPENNSITPPPPGLYEAVFIGAPNNGTVSISSVINDSSYLIGNPYPSALDANKFLIDNSLVLDGTLYFWTHNTSIQLASSITNGSAGSGAYAYTSDDYATYNLTGGVGTSATTIGFGPVVPTGKIASGQAFFASTKPTIPANSSIMFNNSMRVEGTILGNNSQFFRTTKSSKTASVIEKHRVWLNLTNSEGAFKQMLVGYLTDATNDYDNAFDGESFDGNEFIDFYSINEDKNLTIQGRALPFDKNDEVTLGYSSTIEGTFSISIDQVDGILTSEDVFIEDKMTNNVKNLKEGAYSFSTGAGAFNDRFVLRFTQKTLGTDKVGEFDNSVLISNDKNVLKIKSELESIKRITVFDLLGRKLFDKEAVNSNEFSTSNITLNKQLVLVKVMLTNGKVISKKVIY
ncbi:T9SS sorting signal type C domain-containing protein [Flavobacterium yafengii]|uniref:T9SS sorting signal type C domain-containing protein n=1 Tax=Flavobacterium yafengii TaxID=3041253 RepID=A0AAW6TFA1_9FLAO|nr:T9SS sorting signal type C domain-containing protein [Flavobacterium yafengii]MDI5948310.1 T9SS sorting signal type C domain-containing protein [Flavobacterium yafengii]